MTEKEMRLSNSYRVIQYELNCLIDQSLIERYLWYSMGEIILQSASDSVRASAYGVDVCGNMMTSLIGNNSKCHDIIYNVMDKNTDYEETLNRMQISENIQDIGDEWEKILKGGNIDTLVNVSDILKIYSTDFLPGVKGYIEFWNKHDREKYNKQALNKIIRDKSNEIKQFTKIIDGYIEILKLYA